MPNPINPRSIAPNNTLPGSNFHDLRVGSITPGDTFIIGSAFPRNIARFGQATLNVGVNITLVPSFQNIAATSTIAIYVTVQYWIINPSSPRYGRWDLDLDPAYTIASPSPLYDGKDPLLQTTLTLVPSAGDNSFATSIELAGRQLEDGSGGTIDASELLLEPGYFVVHPYYAPYDPRDAKGVGVTTTNIYDLQALCIFALVTTPTYIS